MKEIITHIPTYVYAIFFLLMYLGYKRCFARTVRVERLLLLPLLFLFLSLRSMINLFHIEVFDIFIWIFGSGLGCALGYFSIREHFVRADHVHRLIFVPGDWPMFVLIFLIFAYNFFINYSIAIGMALTQLALFKWVSVFIFGVIAGMIMGRNITYIYKYRKSPSEHLKELN